MKQMQGQHKKLPTRMMKKAVTQAKARGEKMVVMANKLRLPSNKSQRHRKRLL